MSSSYNVGADRAAAAAKVNGPAIALMVTAGIGMLLQVVNLLMTILGTGAGLAGLSGGSGGSPEMERVQALMGGGLGIVLGLFSLAVGVLIFVGALRMKNLTGYGLAWAATVLAMIPCLSPCCCLGIPAGIWAIVALVDQNVKASFV
jgi:hypothetical protein